MEEEIIVNVPHMKNDFLSGRRESEVYGNHIEEDNEQLDHENRLELQSISSQASAAAARTLGRSVKTSISQEDPVTVSPLIFHPTGVLNVEMQSQGASRQDTHAGRLYEEREIESVLGDGGEESDRASYTYGGQFASQEHSQGVSLANASIIEAASSIVESEAPRIQAFAKLEFDDGPFYMNTYSVELGRDIRADRLADRWRREANETQRNKVNRGSENSDDIPPTPNKMKIEEYRHQKNSVVSESGGIMGVDPVAQEPRRTPKPKKSKSTTSSSQLLSRTNSGLIPQVQTDYQSLAMASLTNYTFGAQPVDPCSLLPSPDECPLIPIHPPIPMEGITVGTRSISRKHVKIAFNFEKHIFEISVKGRNGAFVNEQYIPKGDTAELKSGSRIQIGNVFIKFVLPDIAESIISTDFSQQREQVLDDDRESLSVADSSELNSQDEEGESQESAVEQADAEEVEETREVKEEEDRVDRQPQKRGAKAKRKAEVVKESVEKEVNSAPTGAPLKRKGPGRPPKNGFMSKREQALLARQAREAAKAVSEKEGPTPGKGKSSRPTKPTSPPTEPKPEKRKYKKRGQPREQEESRETTDSVPPEQKSQAGQALKPPKEKKPPKLPRSPSPQFIESELTPEQLAKPSASYVVLIHEALSASPAKQMSLPQIYRAIERRYPFFKIKVQTIGWQSSVRHNLSQHPAFKKIERDGKGWMWGLVPEISIEKEKKRRLSPTPAQSQQYYPQAPYPYSYAGTPQANGQPPSQSGYPPYGPHHGIPHGHFSNGPPSTMMPPRPPNVMNLPMASIQSESNYRSPYDTTPNSQPLSQQISQRQPTPVQPPLSYGASSGNHTPNMHSQPVSYTGRNGSHTQQAYIPMQAHYLSNGTHVPQMNTPSHPSPSHQMQAHGQNAGPPFPSSNPYPPSPHNRPPSVRPPSHISEEVLQAVEKFKSVLIASFPDQVRGHQLVTSAINRIWEAEPASGAHIEDIQERHIMKALEDMLGSLNKKQEAHRQASMPPAGSSQLPHQAQPQQQQYSRPHYHHPSYLEAHQLQQGSPPTQYQVQQQEQNQIPPPPQHYQPKPAEEQQPQYHLPGNIFSHSVPPTKHHLEHRVSPQTNPIAPKLSPPLPQQLDQEVRQRSLEELERFSQDPSRNSSPRRPSIVQRTPSIHGPSVSPISAVGSPTSTTFPILNGMATNVDKPPTSEIPISSLTNGAPIDEVTAPPLPIEGGTSESAEAGRKRRLEEDDIERRGKRIASR